MNERVPEGWKTGSLSDVSEKIWIGLVTTMTKFYVKSGVPLIRNSDITESGINLSKLINLENTFANKNKSRMVNKGDVVTVHTGDIGTSSVIEDELDGAHGFATLNTRLRQSSFNPYFYSYVLNSEQFKFTAEKFVTGDGRSNLNLKDFVNLPITYPIMVNEQKKIVSILSSVDEVIEKTQLQINKLQDLKKGTMNELLTKGIGHTEFKDSELGRIPKSWEVRRFGAVAMSIKSGLSRRLSSQDIGIPVINSGNISSRGLNIDKLKYWYFDDPQGAKTENYLLHDGDILLNFINSMSQIGKSCVFEAIGRDCIYTTNLFRIQVGNSIVSSFLHYLMTQERFQKEISLITKPAVNQASFTKDELSNIAIPVPSLFEQDLILRNLSAIEKNITGTYQKLSQTQSLKKSLMQDLLTGKVRVTVN